MLRSLLVAASFVLAIPRFAEGVDVHFLVGDYMETEGGSWRPDQGPLKNPFGVDFDSQGRMYIAELGGGRIHRLDPDGKLTAISGDGSKSYAGDGGPAIKATYNGMHNCVMAKGDHLFISDSWNHCVRRIRLSDDIVDTIAGSGKAGFGGDDGPARSATFDFVMCIALSHDKQTLHIVDLKNRRVRNMNLSTGVVTTVAGNGKKGVPSDGDRATESPLVDPRAATSDAKGNLYVLERGGHALRVVRPDGTIHTVAGTGKKGFRDGPAANAQFGSPKHVCTDAAGNVYIADDQNGAIRKFDPKTSEVTTLLGRGFGDKRIQLKNPHGVRFHDGTLYVVDSGNSRILKIEN